MSKHNDMVIKAAKALNKETADQCNVDVEDQWKEYGETFLDYADVILEAVGAPELLETLEFIECVYRKNIVKEGEPSKTLNDLQSVIAKARGEV